MYPTRVELMLSLKKRLAGLNSAVALLVLAAAGGLSFTIGAGVLLYRNTQKLVSAADWVHHTEEVIAALQNAYLLVERVEYRIPLYQLTSNEEQLNRARTAANQVDTLSIRIRYMVSDNANQTGNVDSLISCGGELRQALVGFTPHSAVPETEIQKCQRTIGRMLDQEQWLLKDRSARTERRSLEALWSEVTLAALSLVTLTILFGLLLRDALHRQRVGKQTTQNNQNLARTVNALEDQATESELLTSVRDELQLCVEVQQVYESAVNGFSRLLVGASGAFCMINNSRQLVEVVSSWGGGETSIEDVSDPDSCCGLRSGHLRWRLPGLSEIHCTHFAGPPPERYLCMPIIAHGNTLGVLHVQCADDSVVQSVNQRMDGLRQLVQLAGMATATLNLRTKLENQSIRDSLTGLFNRHFMQISLERELSRAARRKQILAVFMLDLDHFKKFNDTHGHAAGDTVLKAIAEIFRSSIRAEDIACRYGGEEFTIMLPDVTPTIALERAESIRLAVRNLQVNLEREVYGEFTVSIGVALYPNDGDTADLLLRRADAALYRAKRQGRNQVMQHEAAEMVS